ncbi:MAG: SDR family oxidoreductase [Thermoplasmatota archaeon]
MVSLRELGNSLAFITGGSSGIGLATAKILASKGCRIILAARDPVKLKKGRSKIDGVLDTISLDVSCWKEVEAACQRTIETHGVPNIIINSAGIVHPGTLDNLKLDQIDDMIDIDLKGTMYVCRAFGGKMDSPGHIVNISSMAGVIGLYGYTAYSAAKFGIWGFSEALRMEMNPKGIGVSVIFPPDTQTPQLDFENRTKPQELKEISGTISPIPPEKVAKAILSAIVSGEFMVFPDASSRATYHANRMFGPVVRRYLDGKVRGTSNRNEGGN